MPDKKPENRSVIRPETPVERISIDLDDWYQNQTQPTEARLSALLEQATLVLDRLKSLDSRHEQALGDLESRLGAWTALEASLRVRTRALDDLCEAAAQSVSGIQQTQARFDSLESKPSVAPPPPMETRAPQPPVPSPNTEAWPLDDVLRLHEELRRSSEGGLALPPGPEASRALTGRVELLELAATSNKEELARADRRLKRQRRLSYAAMAALAAGFVATAALAVGWKQSFDARLSEAGTRLAEAQQQAESAARQAEQQIATARQAADRQVAEAQMTARRAQIVSEVLAAPDLMRVNLPGGPRAPQASAQLLLSRSRGVVLSGSRLPSPAAGSQHQLWLLTKARPVGVGAFAPDREGRVMWVSDAVPRVPDGVVGAAITSELTSGTPRRSEVSVRTRALLVTTPPSPVAETPLAPTPQ